MSAAPQDAPEVHIPARARRRQGSAGVGRRTLVVVPTPVVPTPVVPTPVVPTPVVPTPVGSTAVAPAPRACFVPRLAADRDRAPRALREVPAIEIGAPAVTAPVPSMFLAPAPAGRPVELPHTQPLRAEPVRSKVVRTDIAPTPAVLVDGAAVLPEGPGNLTPMRLTRRAHWLIAVATAVLGLALVGGAYSGATGSARSSAPVAAQVVVHSGDTLWSIAAQIAPNRDPRDEVADLRRINGIGAELTPGQIVRTR